MDKKFNKLSVKLVRNEKRNTVTAIISPVAIRFADFLYEKFDSKRYFASGIFEGSTLKEDVFPVAKKILDELNIVAKKRLPEGEELTGKELISMEEGVFRPISKAFNKEGEWNGEFQINLSNNSGQEGKRFLFHDLKGEKPVAQSDAWKHMYAVEVEFSPGYNEDSFEKYIFTVFHRGLVIGRRADDLFEANDEAWEGFDFNVEEDELEEEELIDLGALGSVDDLPF